MSIALHSATLAAQIYLSGESSEHYHAQLKLHLRRSMRLATALSRVMVTGFGRSLASIGLSAFPGTLSLIAKSTRVPDKALNQTRAYLHEQHTSALS